MDKPDECSNPPHIPLPSLDSITTEDERDVYYPDEDTFFMMDALAMCLPDILGTKTKSFLEMGSGSGCVSTAMGLTFPNLRLTCADVNPCACDVTRRTLEANELKDADVVCSNMFSGLSGKTFDIIVFNPPYVPSEPLAVLDSREDRCLLDKALDGGIDGVEVIHTFLREAKTALTRDGHIFLLCTSMNRVADLAAFARDKGYVAEFVARRRITSEVLYMLHLCLQE